MWGSLRLGLGHCPAELGFGFFPFGTGHHEPIPVAGGRPLHSDAAAGAIAKCPGDGRVAVVDGIADLVAGTIVVALGQDLTSPAVVVANEPGHVVSAVAFDDARAFHGPVPLDVVAQTPNQEFRALGARVVHPLGQALPAGDCEKRDENHDGHDESVAHLSPSLAGLVMLPATN